MNILDKAKLLIHIARWRATWEKRDLDYLPQGDVSDKFITARKASELIDDGTTVFSSGMAGNARCSIFFWAIKERFEATGHPRNLTWVKVGAQGSRGRAPGGIEEIGIPGIIRHFIGGHVETEKAILKLADLGELEMHAMPQGVMTFLLEEQAKGELTLLSEVGVNTFLDPRVGTGTAVSKDATTSYVEVDGDKLRYRLPEIKVVMFNASYADKEGNIYFKHMSTITESVESTYATKKNGGIVMVAVSKIIEKNEAEISIPADQVDHIILNPRNEQTGGVPMSRYWPSLTTGSTEDIVHAVAKLRFVCDVMKITPFRDDVDMALARMAAKLFTKEDRRGAIINIGVGYPEEVSRIFFETGLYKDLTFTTETGVYGGLPAPGIFFGSAVNPEKMITSAEMFHLYMEKLNVTMLGSLQTDSEGNVNVSKRGPKALDYVGPGGFPDIVQGAKTVIFVGSWMAGGKLAIEDGKLKIVEKGKAKYVEKVDQVTFSGKQALKLGKKVFYVTNVGIFKLTERGLELIMVVPGIDPQKDIIEGCEAKIHIPENGEIATIDAKTLSGVGYTLSWPGQ